VLVAHSKATDEPAAFVCEHGERGAQLRHVLVIASKVGSLARMEEDNGTSGSGPSASRSTAVSIAPAPLHRNFPKTTFPKIMTVAPVGERVAALRLSLEGTQGLHGEPVGGGRGLARYGEGQQAKTGARPCKVRASPSPCTAGAATARTDRAPSSTGACVMSWNAEAAPPGVIPAGRLLFKPSAARSSRVDGRNRNPLRSLNASQALLSEKGQQLAGGFLR
jgi:hypothetical protein